MVAHFHIRSLVSFTKLGGYKKFLLVNTSHSRTLFLLALFLDCIMLLCYDSENYRLDRNTHSTLPPLIAKISSEVAAE